MSKKTTLILFLLGFVLYGIAIAEPKGVLTGVYKGPNVMIPASAMSSGIITDQKPQYLGTINVELDGSKEMIEAKCSFKVAKNLKGGQKIKVKKTEKGWQVISSE